MPPAVSKLVVFSGQGTSGSRSAATLQQALVDASSPSSGAFLLSQCSSAFLRDLQSLPAVDLHRLHIDLDDFSSSANAILTVHHGRRFDYDCNPVIAGISLFLVQSLRYLAYNESTYGSYKMEPLATCLGFSSGALPASVVACSRTLMEYITHSVAAFRLSLWIGIRVALAAADSLDANILEDRFRDKSWSRIIIGLDEATVSELIEGAYTDKLWITAVQSKSSVTVSGHPSVLEEFVKALDSSLTTVHPTIYGLYHSPCNIAIRDQVVADLEQRSIHLPLTTDLVLPLWCTASSHLMTSSASLGNLNMLLLNMILLYPVRWIDITAHLAQSQQQEMELLNFGPGSGLCRGLHVALQEHSAPSKIVHLEGSMAAPKEDRREDAIAIVGMAVNMPGAPDCESLWEMLENGRNMLSQIPGDRFTESAKPESEHGMKPSYGNFLNNLADFDNAFFKISPREATSMDPQQRVFLHAAYEALENSGYVSGATPSTHPDRVGCYVGVATDDYVHNLKEHKDVYYSSGTLRSFISGRLSYVLKLGGPSIVVDTACSSSTVAMHLAHRALLNKDCDTAVVGGVNAITSPDMTVGLDKGHFLSPNGQCKPFDVSADGYSRGEGCGVFVLKRLQDALAEHDHILGIVRAIEVNQSGRAKSITHPHSPSQATLLQHLVTRAGVHPHRVNFVEAHGTGTQAGDPCELESIRQVFNVGRPNSNPLHVSSIKANIGHLEAASGAASLAKVLLMFKHQSIPRLISFKTLNPRISPLSTDNLLIADKQAAWPRVDGLPLLAAINNFGAAGSNAAILLEEHQAAVGPDAQTPLVFGLSAKSLEALETLKRSYMDWLQTEAGNSSRLVDISYTMTARRQIHCFRTAVVASSKEELFAHLAIAKGEETMLHDEARPIFVFSGQGGQYIGMGQELYERYRVIREMIDDCESALVEAGFPSILRILCPSADAEPLPVNEEIQAFQAALFVMEVGLARLWISWGIQPCAVVGHSLGEYAAFVVSNVLSLKAALTIVANRARLMVEMCPSYQTGMLAINLPPSTVSELLLSDPAFSAISISCYNSPMDTVAGGSLDAIRLFKEHLDSTRLCKSTLLTVPFAYHTEAMRPICDKLTEIARQVRIGPSSIPVLLNVSGNVLAPGEFLQPEYFAMHCVSPVQLDRSINNLASQIGFEDTRKTWIEIGPHPSILPMIKSNESSTAEDIFLPSLRRGQDSQLALANSLRKLYQQHLSIDWRAVYADTDAHCISLPSYPFEKKRFFVPYGAPGVSSLRSPVLSGPQWKLLGHRIQQQDTLDVFEIPMERLVHLIRGHVVAGMPLCPASTYIEVILAAVNSCGATGPVSLENLQFIAPLVHDVAKRKSVVTRVEKHGSSGALAVYSRASDGAECDHIQGRYNIQSTEEVQNNLAATWKELKENIAAITNPSSPLESFSTRTLYDVIFQRVVQYSREYQTLQMITLTDDHMEACGIAQLPPSHEREGYVISPIFVDTLLHAAGFVANMHSAKDAFICNGIEQVLLAPELLNTLKPYRVYCKCTWSDEETMLADSYAIEMDGQARVVALLCGMQFRKVRMEGLRKGLALSAGKPPQYTRVRSATVVDRPRVSGRARSSTIMTLTPPKLVLSSVEVQVRDIVASACGLESGTELTATSNLKSLGVDSLMFIEISMKLRKALQLPSMQALSACETVEDMVSLVMKNMQRKTGASVIDTPPASPTTKFSPGNGRLPTVYEG